MKTTLRVSPFQRGVSLIELMVALIIGLFLIFGAVTIYQQSRTTFRTTEAVARLQEVARLAFDVLESDVRMASYWGLNNRAEFIVNRGFPGLSTPSPFSTGQAAIISACGTVTNSNWAINLDQYIGGTNGGFGLAAGCGAFQGAATSGDMLVVRRAADAQPTQLDGNRIYLQTSRIQGTLFVPVAGGGCDTPMLPTDPDCIPAAYAPPASQSRQLVVHAYYVSTRSTFRNDVPSLRRKSLGNINASSAADAFTDEEIVPGVEDMQVRFGVDTNGDTNVDQYVDPGAVPGGAAVMSATIWLRIRSEERDFSHVDGTTYSYAGVTTAAPNDNYRRIVVSKTIMLRNTRV